jgi:GMP reductase
MKIEQDVKLDFSDVLIRPKRTTLSSRNDVDIEREFKFPHSKQIWKGIPIIAANMDTVGTLDMYNVLNKYNMITCLHKFIDIDDIPDTIPDATNNNYCLTIGLRNENIMKTLKEINEKNPNACNIICVDVANGYMNKLVDACLDLRKNFPNAIIIAGNVVSREMVEELIINGKVDIVKVGIGSGSVCTTRLQTGVGMPQLSAVLECADAAHGCGGHIISDGGITCPGDAAKAFGAGADFVMLGSMLAGHDECPGELIEENGVKYKMFYGMSSDTAMNKHYGGVSNYRSSEGKTVKVKHKGPVENTIKDLLGGLRSTCTYVNAKKLKDLSKCVSFMRVNNQVNTIYK